MTPSKVAVFDLDETITRHDTLIPFLRELSTLRLLWGVTRALPWLLASLWNRSRRDDAKKAVIRATLNGRSVEDVETAAAAFAEGLLSNGLNSSIVEHVTEHQGRGHRVVLASATPSALVIPIAAMLGITETIATELEIRHGSYTGRFIGANNRGSEKRRRVLATLGERPDYAYGNLPDDRALLDAADSAFVVRNGAVIALP